MPADEERVVVIRAWLYAGRLMIRVLAGQGPDSPGEEWVYADIGAAADRLSILLEELGRGPGAGTPAMTTRGDTPPSNTGC